MLFAIHLRDELGKHDLIELLPTGAARHLGLERLGLRKHAVNVGVAAHNHLWRAIAEHIERAPSRPFGHVAVRVRLELGAAEIDVDDVAAIQWHYALTIAFTGVQVNWDSWMDPAFRQRRNMLALRSVHDGRARNYLSHQETAAVANSRNNAPARRSGRSHATSTKKRVIMLAHLRASLSLTDRATSAPRTSGRASSLNDEQN
jgi:hypothetical protein